MATDPAKAIRDYLKSIQDALARGDSTEHTHRLALVNLIQQLEKGVIAVNEPKGSEGRHPDIRVLLGETPLGYIETKDVGAKLAEVAETEQLLKYRQNIPNLILTDYLEFRWYQKGNLMFTARLAAETSPGKLRRYDTGEQDLLTLVRNFLRAEITVTSPKELAQRMAVLAQWVRRVISAAFEAESAGAELHSQLKAFREVLLPDLDVPKFADMYAQTICYGLFAGKCNTDTGITFARDNAASYLPKTNPFLRKLFASIMSGDLNEKVAGAIDAITFLLNHADIGAILKDFGKRTRQEDPVVHFYETFLAAYDPKLRKSRGVYYTPEPVVSYIVRSVDWLLKEKFGKKDGLADPSVLVLDPACGTGTFLYHVIKLIHERVEAKGQYGTWSSYVRDSLLPRIFGFELLMAPYAVAHLKLGLLLQDTGYDFGSEERLGIYLTNTLEEAARKSDVLFAQYISDEANAATDIKRDKPIMVVLGNPPYSGISANKNAWIDGLLHGQLPDGTKTGSYYEVDGGSLGERKVWLQDDYVKFIRWSQWRIEKTGLGIHAYISNNGYLDNPTFRGLRQQLTKSFDGLNILDLHGNSKKKEVCPDGTRDENVFDITQGVAIGVFIKGDLQRRAVRHADVWGDRDRKYRWLLSHDIASSRWKEVHPSSPNYFLVPQDLTGEDELKCMPSVSSLVPIYVNGMVTARDGLVIDFDKTDLLNRMHLMVDSSKTDAEVAAELSLKENYAWRVGDARASLRRAGVSPSRLRMLSYRPFDDRWLYADSAVVWRLRADILVHMTAGCNLAFVVPKRVEIPGGWMHAFVTRREAEHVAVSSKTTDYVFPLYLYPSMTTKSGQQELEVTETPTWAEGKDGRVPNLSPEFVAQMEQKLGLKFVPEQPEAVSRKQTADSPFGPEDVFDYIYAVFHSPTYRKRYAEFLKIDFPRVPLTSDKRLFWKLVALGRELVAMHLLESPKVDDFVTKYPKKGPDKVEKVVFSEAVSRKPSAVGGLVYINSEQYFEGVKPEWWEFHIGGYQVLQKWLKDRKGRKLSNDDIRHYQRVVVAIKETIRLMAEIDKAIPKWPIE